MGEIQATDGDGCQSRAGEGLMRYLFRRTAGSESTNRKIFRAAMIIGFLTLLVKVGNALKEVLVARLFGRSDVLDAFLIAYLVPSFVIGLVMGALGSAFIPTFVETREKQGADAARKLFSSVLVLSVVALFAITILLGLFAPRYLPYLGSSFSIQKLRLTRELLYVLLPFVMFGGLAVFITAVLNAGEKFALPALTPLVTPVVTILFITASSNTWGVFSLACGIVVGSVLEAILLLWGLKAQGMLSTLKRQDVGSSTRGVLRQCMPMLAATFLTCGTSVVDQSMAAMLPGGSVAALSYANRIVGAILGIGALGLSTAALSYFSKMAAENDWRGCRHTLRRYSVLVASATVPLTVCLMVFSKPLVRLLFQRGAFTGADTELVSWVLVCYAIQIPFYVCGIIFVKFLSSIRRNDVLMYGAVISLFLDVMLNLVLMRVWGTAGIAMSTSIVYVVSFLFLSTCSIKILAGEHFSVPAVMPAERAIR
jgi:putative peptidoglycan lipid II flippase